MAKQLLFYETAVPLNSNTHRRLSFQPVPGYSFASGINAVPLAAIEIVPASAEYAVVFTTVGEDILPMAVLGLRADQNLYVSDESQWDASYVPAFVRRYPFVFASSADKKTLTLCIDDTHPGFNSEGRGDRLFGDDGQPSAYTNGVMAFLKDYQANFERTKVFCKHLVEHGLLEPMEAVMTLPGGNKMPLRGFQGVSRERLKALDAATLATLAKTDELELIYLHMASLRNFNRVKDRFVGTMPALMQEAPAAAPS